MLDIFEDISKLDRFFLRLQMETGVELLPADLGYLYENVVAQMIKASGRDLYYHTWRKKKAHILMKFIF